MEYILICVIWYAVGFYLCAWSYEFNIDAEVIIICSIVAFSGLLCLPAAIAIRNSGRS